MCSRLPYKQILCAFRLIFVSEFNTAESNVIHSCFLSCLISYIYARGKIGESVEHYPVQSSPILESMLRVVTGYGDDGITDVGAGHMGTKRKKNPMLGS